MLSRTPQKWQTGANLGTLVFLEGFLVTGFGSCLNKEQFGLMWSITPQRWQVGTRTDFFLNLLESLDIGLKTSSSTSEFLHLSNLAT